MIRFVRTASIMPGKLPEAVAFANQIREYCKKKYSTQIELRMPMGGNPDRISWTSNYNSIADLEEVLSKLAVDKKYIEQLSRVADYFISGSIFDEIWRAI